MYLLINPVIFFLIYPRVSNTMKFLKLISLASIYPLQSDAHVKKLKYLKNEAEDGKIARIFLDHRKCSFK